MNYRDRAVRLPRIKLISAAVASCFASHLAFANPTGPAVVNGQVTFHQQGNLLQITNSPSSIINWQSFSIGANEITRFLQQSPSSAVLNRVVTQNPSSILGALQSNGRVLLINPSGILFGAGAQIDVAGLVASTLKLSDADFLAGRLKFTDGIGAGSVINQGTINAATGGHVYLVGPAVTNGGVITSPRGEVVLAAGNNVELVNPGTPNLRVEITAPDNQAINLGQIVADSGRVGIYAGLINQSGVVQANTAVATEDGRIVLKATNSANLAAGSVTTATGPLEIEAGEILVSGNVTSGPQTINAGGGLIVQSSAAGPAQLTASGGQAINAAFVEVTARGGGAQIFNGFTGDQIITTTGANAGGESLAVRNLGGTGVPASIMQNSSGRQVVDVSGKLTVEGGSAPAGQPAGVIFLGIGTSGQQVVSAESIRLQGGSGGSSNSAFISAFSGTQEVIAGTGGITLIGGSGGTTNTASIGVNNSSQQIISSAGGITLIGGTGGTSNFASIGQGASGGLQNVTVNGGAITLQGGIGGANNFAQILGANGQSIIASEITVTGGSSGTNNFARIRNTQNAQQTISATDIAITGGSDGGSNFAEIIQAGPLASQTVTASKSIAIGGGLGGTSNFARIRNDGIGPQTITGSPTIEIQGGTGGAPDQGNFAQIRAAGLQNITAGPTMLTAGTSGFNNFATLSSPNQIITVHGDLTLNGGGSSSGPTSGASARIGGNGGGASTPTNLALVVDGNLTMNGGTASSAGSFIGSDFAGGLPTNITMDIGGNLTMNPGPLAVALSGSRIGSPSAGNSGGNISITADGNITMNGSILPGSLGSVIRTTDAVMLDANNITIGGAVFSRAQSISATGNITVAAAGANNATVSATGPQNINAGGALTVQGGAGTGLSAQILGSNGQTISASSINVIGGSIGNSSFAEILQTGLGAGQAITASDSITIAGGPSGSNNFARIRNEGMGAQTITGSPVITLTGGTGGAPNQGNIAQIRSSQGLQTITAANVSLTGGGPGFSNFAGIHSPNQIITVHGDLALTGGSSSPGSTSVGAARIGGNGGAVSSPTNLMLVVDGNVTMNGGTATNAGSTIGSSFDGGQPTSITMSVGGNLTMFPGTVDLSGARIGSPTTNTAGGNISISTGGDIILNGNNPPSRTAIHTTDNITLHGNSIIQAADAVVQGNRLTTDTVAGAHLDGNNQVAAFNATNTASGDVVLNNSSTLLTVTGVNQVPFGALTINQTGDLTLTGAINSGPQTFSATGNISVVPSSPTFVSSSGLQTINAGGGLIVQSSAAGPAQLTASGGQTIDARFVEVTAAGGEASITNWGSGDQIITTTGMNLTGEGLAVRNLGEPAFAGIAQNAPGQAQFINIGNADKVTIDGAGPSASIFANGGLQTLSVTGTGANAINIGSAGALGGSIIFGGSQDITAGASGQSGSITIVGSATNGQLAGFISNGQQNISTSGMLSVTGGSAPGQPLNFSGLVAHNGAGQQTVNAFGITLQGGPSGSRNNAQVAANTGSQQITVGAGGITLTGGTGGENNFAQIRQNDAALIQTITVTGGGNVVLQGGAGGTNNAARIFGANQLITATGNVTLSGSSGSGNSSTIGSVSGEAHNLVLTTGGDVVLTGGSAALTGAQIGNTGTAPLQPTNIAINAGGDVILTGGTGGGARIGSSINAPAAGGDISISAGESIQLSGTAQAARIRTLGNVTLQAGTTISEGPNGLIEANTLTTTSNAGTSLTGPNQVANVNAINAATGDIALVNSGNLAAMASNRAPGGKITINNLSGDLSTSGAVAALGGGAADVALAAGGAVNIAHPVTASGIGNISLAGSAITVDDTSVTAGGSVAVNGASLDVMGVSSGALIEAGNGFDANLSGDLRVRSASAGGGLGGWATILTSHGPVDITAGNVVLEGGKNLGGFAAITGGPVTITSTGDINIKGGSGVGAFGWLLSNQDVDLTVGGSLRLNSGTGFGSFARLETISPWSTINVHFPNLSSGGYYVNGVEGRIRQGLTGIFTGLRPATLGDTLIVTYGE